MVGFEIKFLYYKNVKEYVITVKPVYNDITYNDKPVYNDNCFSPENKGFINIQPLYNDNLRITIHFLDLYNIVIYGFYCIT